MSTIGDMFGALIAAGDNFLFVSNHGLRLCRCVEIPRSTPTPDIVTFVSAARTREGWKVRRKTTISIPRTLIRLPRSLLPPELLVMFDAVTPPEVAHALELDMRATQSRLITLDRLLKLDGRSLAEVDEAFGIARVPTGLDGRPR